MPPKTSKSVIARKPQEFHGYEFFGPPGATAICIVLPLLMWTFAFFCNDISGCPVPSTLSPSTLTIEKLKQDIGWPSNGVRGMVSLDAFVKTLGYYAFSLVLYKVLPGQEMDGLPLVMSGTPVRYKFNTWHSSLITLAILAAGTAAQGAEFPVWTFINDNYLQILTSNIIIAYAMSIFVYVRSFSVNLENDDNRELAAGGTSGNMIYDFYIGRELNPPITIPWIGTVDIKTFMEVRPGLLGWIILDYAFMAKQYQRYGFISDSMLLTTAFQSLYVLDCFWFEPSILTQIDTTTDGFGFMLAFGDLVWVPFLYSTSCRYLSVYPLELGIYGTAGVFAILGAGYTIFRLSNNQKNLFRTNPLDPKVAHLTYIQTARGSKLLTSGWWGISRHFNYFGDWLQSWAYVLPTGVAGYLVQRSSFAPTPGQSPADGSQIFGSTGVETQVVQGSARGWGMIFTYFYIVYFGVLLVHRERRDEAKCARKYGEDWKKYKEVVRYRIIPGIY